MSKPLVIGTVVVVVGLFTIGGFLLWQAGPNQVSPTPAEQQTNEQTSSPSVFEPSPQPKTEVFDISTWQTYRNDEFGFEVKYPENRFSGVNIEPRINDFLFYGPMTLLLGIDNYVDGVYVPSFSVMHTQLDLSSYQERTTEYTDYFGYEEVIFEPITIDGREGYRYQGGSFNMGVLCLTEETLIGLEEGSIVLQYSICSENHPGVTEEEEGLFDQILSTFRFVDSINASIIEQIKNLEYTNPSGGEKIKLTDGVYEKSFPDSASKEIVQIYNNKIAFGDLNDDGDEDAAIILTANAGGTGSFRAISAVVDKDGILQEVATKDLGDRVIINSISIQDGEIVLDMVVHGEGENFQGLCCPNVQTIKKFKLENNELIEI